MTRLRTGDPWMPAPEFAKTLTGLSINLIVRGVGTSLPFYTDVLGFTELYSDADFAALELKPETGETVRVQLHADHTWENMPIAGELQALGPRGIGVELRVLGLDPDAAQERAQEHGVEPAIAVDDWGHGWREVHLRDPDGYLWVVGRPVAAKGPD